MTSHFLLGSSTLQQAVTIEIEPQMIAGSRMFYPANRRVFDDRRSRFVVDDAKSFFATDARKYDIIISEPSNPWVSGVAGLFTDEFYHRVRGYLTPRGVFGQWLHLYEINDGLVLSVLSAIHRNFSSYSVYLTSNDDMLIVASNLPELPAPDWSILSSPGIASDLAGVVPFTPSSLNATHLIDRRELAPSPRSLWHAQLGLSSRARSRRRARALQAGDRKRLRHAARRALRMQWQRCSEIAARSTMQCARPCRRSGKCTRSLWVRRCASVAGGGAGQHGRQRRSRCATAAMGAVRDDSHRAWRRRIGNGGPPQRSTSSATSMPAPPAWPTRPTTRCSRCSWRARMRRSGRASRSHCATRSRGGISRRRRRSPTRSPRQHSC